MQSFRVEKSKPRKSSKPAKSWSERRNEIADSISIEENVAMVACTSCVNNKLVCYYDREQSVKCAACLRHQRDCDGTFSLEEFRKIGEQKKQLKVKALEKRREIARLRKVLAELEEEDVAVQDDLVRLDDISSRMLQREMQALGVMDSVGNEQEVALADPNFVWEGVPAVESIDWEQLVRENSGGTPLSFLP
jgi:hypothetical protein